MKSANDKLKQIYDYIEDYLLDNGFPPTIREIGAHFGIKSTSTVNYYLERLKKDGAIVQSSNKNRAIGIVNKKNSNFALLPLVGNVSAGIGILAVENIEGYFPIPNDIYSGEDLFLLRVEGDSMIKCGISDGDFVVVNKQAVAEIGEIVVVFWNDNATIKRLVSTVPFVLHPENDAMEDILITQFDNPTIIGKVVGCMKRF